MHDEGIEISKGYPLDNHAKDSPNHLVLGVVWGGENVEGSGNYNLQRASTRETVVGQSNAPSAGRGLVELSGTALGAKHAVLGTAANELRLKTIHPGWGHESTPICFLGVLLKPFLMWTHGQLDSWWQKQ